MTTIGQERYRSSSRELNESRIHNRWPVAREGLPFILASSGITIFFACLGLVYAAIFMAILAGFIIFFFRDPERRHSEDAEGTVLAPADGTVLEARSIEGADNPIGMPGVRVSIFMSVFNVHVNRIPVDGTIEAVSYAHGRFFSANLDKASAENERNTIVITADSGRRLAVVQVAGLIARRIACWVRKGDRVARGQRFGLIRFGSRLEVYLPGNSRIVVREREKVRAGVTPIAYFP